MPWLPWISASGVAPPPGGPCCVLGSQPLDYDASIGDLFAPVPFVALITLAVTSARPNLIVQAHIGWELLALLGSARLRLRVDGAPIAHVRQDSIIFVPFRPASIGGTVFLPPGPHVINLDWATDAGVFAICNPVATPTDYSGLLLASEW